MTEVLSPVKKYLRLLYRDQQTYSYFKELYKACKYSSNDDLFDYKK